MGEKPLKYKEVIKNTYQALKENGIFIIDNRSWEWIPEEKEEIITDEVETKDGALIQTRIHDKYTSDVRIRNVTTDINGKKHIDLCITYLLKERDWIKELKIAGFKKFEVLHDYKKTKVEKPKRIIIIAKK